MKISAYSFGRMVINDKQYNEDVVIAAGKIHTPWFRRQGHNVEYLDLKQWLAANPRCLIIGSGAAGCCQVDHELAAYCKQHSVELVVKPTTQAVEYFNQLKDQSNTVAAFHLTC